MNTNKPIFVIVLASFVWFAATVTGCDTTDDPVAAPTPQAASERPQTLPSAYSKPPDEQAAAGAAEFERQRQAAIARDKQLAQGGKK